MANGGEIMKFSEVLSGLMVVALILLGYDFWLLRGELLDAKIEIISLQDSISSMELTIDDIAEKLNVK